MNKIVPIAVLLDPSYNMFRPDRRISPHPEPDGDEGEDPSEVEVEDPDKDAELEAMLARFYQNLVGYVG